jgi:uncharacterized repeat protein (TIGR04138 family)
MQTDPDIIGFPSNSTANHTKQLQNRYPLMSMTDDSFTIYQLVKQDPRYPAEAYHFVREAMAYASDLFELGGDPHEADVEPEIIPDEELDFDSSLHQSRRERHLTGQQLCEAIRQYALNQFGYMAKVVLTSWGVDKTDCFGDIVFNMIDIGLMKKSEKDRKSHFNGVFDFNEEFDSKFDICQSINHRT